MRWKRFHWAMTYRDAGGWNPTIYGLWTTSYSKPLKPIVFKQCIAPWMYHHNLLLGIHCFYLFLVSFPQKFSASLHIPTSRRSGKPGLKDVHSRKQASSSWPEAAACPSWWTRYHLKSIYIVYIYILYIVYNRYIYIYMHIYMYIIYIYIYIYIWLVVWNHGFLWLPLGIIIPTDELMFFRGLKPPTRYIYIYLQGHDICPWAICWFRHFSIFKFCILYSTLCFLWKWK